MIPITLCSLHNLSDDCETMARLCFQRAVCLVGAGIALNDVDKRNVKVPGSSSRFCCVGQVKKCRRETKHCLLNMPGVRLYFDVLSVETPIIITTLRPKHNGVTLKSIILEALILLDSNVFISTRLKSTLFFN